MHHFAYRRGVSHNNVLHAEDVDLSALAHAVGTPLYCYSTATLERHYRVFAEAFAGVPETLVCFSVKANSNLGVLATSARTRGECTAREDRVLRRRQDQGGDGLRARYRHLRLQCRIGA